MTRKEYEKNLRELRDEIELLRNKERDLRHDYGIECLERSGYHIGDRMEINGIMGEIVDTDMVGDIYAAFKKVKKDGTISPFACHYLRIKLKEE